MNEHLVRVGASNNGWNDGRGIGIARVCVICRFLLNANFTNHLKIRNTGDCDNLEVWEFVVAAFNTDGAIPSPNFPEFSPSSIICPVNHILNSAVTILIDGFSGHTSFTLKFHLLLICNVAGIAELRTVDTVTVISGSVLVDVVGCLICKTSRVREHTPSALKNVVGLTFSCLALELSVLL